MWKQIQAVRNKLKERSKSRRSRPQRASFDIYHDSSKLRLCRLTMENLPGDWEIDWDNVTSVLAFKRDLSRLI